MEGSRFILFWILVCLSIFCASAETQVFCDSTPLKDVDWSEDFTLPKFDSALGSLKAVDILIDVNLSQEVKVENIGKGNSTVNSMTESVLSLVLPSGEAIKTTASLEISKNLTEFDGINDFSGSSGMDLTETGSSGTKTHSYSDTSDFVASTAGETIVLKGIMESMPKVMISGTCSSEVHTMADARVCVSYRYDAKDV